MLSIRQQSVFSLQTYSVSAAFRRCNYVLSPLFQLFNTLNLLLSLSRLA